MDIFKPIAILGALAWLPHLITLVRNLFLKPKISINSYNELEIGYTTLGPVLNINIAFSAENKHALIEKIYLIIKHESNEIHLFSWDWFEEYLYEMDTIDSGPLNLRKNQKAIAIKVQTDTLMEKKVGFQDPAFKEKYNELFNLTNIVYVNLFQGGKDINDLSSTNEYNEFSELFKNSFIWKVGKYSVKIKVYIKNRKKSFEHKLEFQLTNLDKNRLETNVETCLKVLKNHYITEDQKYKSTWEWAKPYKTETIIQGKNQNDMI